MKKKPQDQATNHANSITRKTIPAHADTSVRRRGYGSSPNITAPAFFSDFINELVSLTFYSPSDSALSSACTADFCVFVRLPCGRTCIVRVCSTDTILHIKHTISHKYDISPDKQFLVLNGKLLNDTATVLQSNIKSNSTLNLLIRLHGGMLPAAPAAGQADRVAVKLPPYWPNDPTLWFAQVEAQFAIGQIKDEHTKFHYVVSQLPPDTATEVRDLILTPPNDPYNTLKDTLVKRTSESAAQRIKKALAAAEIGDTKPTQILRALKLQLEGMQADDKLVLQVFLQKLPATVRSIVAAQSDKMKLDELADLADRVHEHLPENASTCAAASNSSSDHNWEKRMSRLENMMENLLSHDRPRSRGRPHFRRPSRSTSRGRFNPQGKLCYYHWRYREKAIKCTAPCQWKSHGSTSSSSKNETLQ